MMHVWRLVLASEGEGFAGELNPLFELLYRVYRRSGQVILAWSLGFGLSQFMLMAKPPHKNVAHSKSGR